MVVLRYTHPGRETGRAVIAAAEGNTLRNIWSIVCCIVQTEDYFWDSPGGVDDGEVTHVREVRRVHADPAEIRAISIPKGAWWRGCREKEEEPDGLLEELWFMHGVIWECSVVSCNSR